jgi:hypothetical protein
MPGRPWVLDRCAFFATIRPAAAAFEGFFRLYAQCLPEEPAFARLAPETNALEVVGPPLAESDPLSRKKTVDSR